MSSFIILLASLPLLSGLFGVSDTFALTASPMGAAESVEIGLVELSPAGTEGGYAVPASGSSYTCTLTVTPNPSTAGQNVTLTWSSGPSPMTVTRGATNLGSRSSGWTDTSASSLAAGTYTYTVSGDGTVTHDGTPDTYSCSRALTVNAAAQPDLIANAPAVSGTGTTRTFSGTVRNGGTVAAGAFANRFELDLNSDGSVDTNIVATGVASLAAGATSASLSGAPWTTVAGTHRVRLVADTGAAITESNEANNTSAWTSFTIQPDLTSSNVTLNSGSLMEDTPLTFNGTVSNANVATASGFTDRFSYRQLTIVWGFPVWGSWVDFSDVAQAALAVGASANNTSGSVQFSSAGTVEIRLCADSGSVISESNESNNCATQQFVIAAAPAAPTVTSCTASPNPSAIGQSVTWTANVTGGQAPLSYAWTGTDGLGGTYAINTVSHTYNSAGTKNATVNVTDNLGQSSGAYACTALTVSAPAAPTVDLNIREVGVGAWGGSVTVDAGDNVELQWSSSGADSCTGDSYFSTAGALNGTQSTVSEPASGVRVYRVTCENDGVEASDTATVNVNAPAGSPSLSGSPSRVQQGDQGSLDFDTGGHTNCIITGTNGDVFDLTALYPGQQTGTITTSSIVGETVYTMQCDLASTETTIRIFPVFEEI